MKENSVLLEDLESLAYDASIPWRSLKGKTVLITGSTGLIGGLVAKSILHANKVHGLQSKVIAVVRDAKKAEKHFFAYLESHSLKIWATNLDEPLELTESLDYVIHAASVTQSKSFVESPVNVLKTTLWSTDHLLKLAKDKQISSMVYLSSMEVYGTFKNKEVIAEDDFGYLNPFSARSSYSEGKQAAETLCYAYYSQYNVPVKTARLTLTFGAGVSLEDNRVFAQFCAKARQGQDIVLHTKGETKRDYLYTADAVAAILIILLKGEDGQAYNVANSDTYISIRDMANLVASQFSKKSKVVVNIPDNISEFGYAPTVKLNLNTDKLKKLGWSAKYNLSQMYKRLIDFMKEETSA